jgi:hypothetical protein
MQPWLVRHASAPQIMAANSAAQKKAKKRRITPRVGRPMLDDLAKAVAMPANRRQMTGVASAMIRASAPSRLSSLLGGFRTLAGVRGSSGDMHLG